MNERIEGFLFDKHILVCNGNKVNQVETLYALRNKLNIKIVDGFELACPEMIRYAASRLGQHIPHPFYVGFPKSVRELTLDQLLFDQLIHYTMTYGFGNFEEAGHSLFEDAVERSLFNESENPPHEFTIMDEEEAIKAFLSFCDDMAAGSRPLNPEMLQLLYDATEYYWFPKNIGSKQTACELIWMTKNPAFAKFLSVPDFIKLVDTINYRRYHKDKINKLNLKNQDRKLLTKVLDLLLQNDDHQERICFEKRDAWKGVLHHIHYKPKTEAAKAFVEHIYGKFPSNMGTFENFMNMGLCIHAARYLLNTKGNGALLRNLNYIVSRSNDTEIKMILELIEAKSPIILLQMMYSYNNYKRDARTFKFTRHDRVRIHKELIRPFFNVLPQHKIDLVVSVLEEKLKLAMRGKEGKVYIDPAMYEIGVPLNMSASSSGFGVMPVGSHIHLPEGKKIRAFTYWEKVNDIDLSCIGIDGDGNKIDEFSWRTMAVRNNGAITFSGDETSGYNGGSEYFDIDVAAMKERYPKMRYVIFCNNVYSDSDFSKCVCTAGWMSRDILDSGEVYEPKTVRSSFVINANSTYAYLFAIDLDFREVIWLNLADARNTRVAGTTELGWLTDYFNMTDVMSVGKLFSYMGEVVGTPDKADLVIGDVVTNKPQIHSWEFEKVMGYLN